MSGRFDNRLVFAVPHLARLCLWQPAFRLAPGGKRLTSAWCGGSLILALAALGAEAPAAVILPRVFP
jgi:hypothetical protein